MLSRSCLSRSYHFFASAACLFTGFCFGLLDAYCCLAALWQLVRSFAVRNTNAAVVAMVVVVVDLARQH